MDDIKLKKSEGKVCISSDKLSVADFGDNLDEAKNSFKKAVNLMLDTKLDELQEN